MWKLEMRIVLALLLFLQAQSLASTSRERGWRGIVPLQSKRNEVEKLLGPPSKTLPGAALYRTTEGTVRISYSEGTPCGTKDSHWRVPADTVIVVDVTLSPGHLLSKLNLDEAKYTKKSGGHRSEDVYYVNEEKGEVLRVFNDEVMDIHYGPTSSDKDLKCPLSKQS
jgi:hypothetical protein